MRLTVLGCYSPYPPAHGATAGYLVQTRTTNLLLDCGSGVIAQLMKHLPLHQLDAVILSHFHYDHAADVGVLQYGLHLHQKMGESRTKTAVPLFAPAFPAESFTKLTYRNATRGVPIHGDSVFTVGDLRVSFRRTHHDLECYAVRLEHDGKVLVYGADSGPQTNWEQFLEEADLFVCEGTFLERNKPADQGGHLTVKEAALLGQRYACRRLMITHLFPAYTYEEVLAETIPYVRGESMIARTGMILTL